MIHANLTSAFLPIGWGPFQDVNLLYFLLKMQIWNGCNVFNIVGKPLKDININLSFLSSRWKVLTWNGLLFPRIGKFFENAFLNIVENPIKDINVNLVTVWVQDEKLWNGPQDWNLSSGWKVVDWTFPGLENFLNAFLSSGYKVVGWTPQIWHLMEILEILLVHVQSNDTCKFAITLFSHQLRAIWRC